VEKIPKRGPAEVSFYNADMLAAQRAANCRRRHTGVSF
jgi:hypothetical protein